MRREGADLQTRHTHIRTHSRTHKRTGRRHGDAWRLRDASVWLMVAVLMITAGYMGAVSVVTTVKWFWFLFGMAMFLPVIYSLARTFRETVITRKDPEMIELYGKIAWLTIIMWSFYPVVWLFSEGFASFSVSFEVLSLSCCYLRCRAAVCPVQRL